MARGSGAVVDDGRAAAGEVEDGTKPYTAFPRQGSPLTCADERGVSSVERPTGVARKGEPRRGCRRGMTCRAGRCTRIARDVAINAARVVGVGDEVGGCGRAIVGVDGLERAGQRQRRHCYSTSHIHRCRTLECAGPPVLSRVVYAWEANGLVGVGYGNRGSVEVLVEDQW